MPIWWDESERVTFNAKSRVSKSRAAVDRAQESAGKNKKSVPGQYFVAEPIVIDGGDFPTRDEWLEEQARKNGSSNVSSKFSDTSRANIQQGRK